MRSEEPGIGWVVEMAGEVRSGSTLGRAFFCYARCRRFGNGASGDNLDESISNRSDLLRQQGGKFCEVFTTTYNPSPPNARGPTV